MNQKLNTPTEKRQMQEDETKEMLWTEDVVQTTAYLANAPAVREPISLKICPECSVQM